MDFTHYTDPPVRLAIDLINTRSMVTGEDRLATPDDLRRFLRDHDGDWRVTDSDLERVRSLRERLREALEVPDEARAVEVLNQILREVRAVPRLTVHEHRSPHLHFEPERAEDPAGWLGASAAMGLAVVLCEHRRERFGVCEASDCADVYVDTSRNRSRRYCSDTCTTREGVAAYRRRHRERG